MPGRRTEHTHNPHGVKHQLSVTEVHPFGHAGRPGGVERSGTGIFIEIGKIKFRQSRFQQSFVLTGKGDGGHRQSRLIVEQDKAFDRIHAPSNLLKNR